MKVAAMVALGLFLCGSPICAQQYLTEQNHGGGSGTHFDFSQANGGAHGTVNVGIALSEGLVLAADSRLTLITTQTFPGYMVLSDNTSKVFAVGNFGISTYGEAFLGNRTVASWVADYAVKLHHKDDDVVAFSKRFSDYIGKLYDDDPAGKANRVIGFLIAGYDSNGDGKLLSVEFPGTRQPVEVKNTKSLQGVQWEGDTETSSAW